MIEVVFSAQVFAHTHTHTLKIKFSADLSILVLPTAVLQLLAYLYPNQKYN